MINVYNGLKNYKTKYTILLLYKKLSQIMNRLKFARIIIVFSSISFLSFTFLRNYNSPENIEKRCLLKFENDFKIPLEATNKEWEQILDLADNNYLKCMGIPQY